MHNMKISPVLYILVLAMSVLGLVAFVMQFTSPKCKCSKEGYNSQRKLNCKLMEKYGNCGADCMMVGDSCVPKA